MTIESNGNGHGRDPGRSRSGEAEGHSGSRFLIVAGITLLTVWALLYLGFRQWRAGYRDRAEFGLSRVVPAIDGLAAVVPPGGDVTPEAWRDAVDQTRAMLKTVVASNLLDRDQMEALRAELDDGVARARSNPDTAQAELAAVWDSMADRAEFLLTEKDRHPRPRVLPPRQAPRRASIPR